MRLRILPSLSFIAAFALAACSDAATLPTDPALSKSSTVAKPDTTSASSTDTTSSSSSGYYGDKTRIRLEARLAPPSGGTFRRASGKAKWDSRNSNSKRELEIEVEDVAAGTTVEFFVNNVQVGSSVTVDSFGNARVELSTQLGHVVPTAAAGLRAKVRAGGVVVVTGVFPG
jgi:hypothetical protein